MRSQTTRLLCTCLGGTALALTMAAGAAAQTYRLTDLGPLGFEPNVDLHGTLGINARGQVVYGYDPGGGPRAFVWLPEQDYGLPRGLYDLAELFGTGEPSIARDLNTQGQIAGQVGGIDTGEGEAVVWDLEAGTVRPLGFLPDASWSRAIAIGEAPDAVVVGESETLTICPDQCERKKRAREQLFLTSFRASLAGPAPVLVPLVPLGCDTSSVARDVSTGPGWTRIVGFSDTIATQAGCLPFTPSCPFEGIDPVLWLDPVSGVELPGLDAPGNVLDGEARGVDALGRAVGWGFEPRSPFCLERALYWETPGSVVDLNAVLPPGRDSRAEALNGLEAPQVVGWSWEGTTQHAVLWENHGGAAWTATDLNTAIPECSRDLELEQGHDINNSGWIAAWGRVDPPGPGFERHAVVLTPVGPNPSDLDGDGIVGIVDFLELLASWGPCSAGIVCRADVDLDCTVGISDFLKLLADWTL